MTPANRPMTPGEWATLLVLAAVWGGSFFFNAVALGDLPVLTVVTARVGLAALLLAGLLAVAGQRFPRDARVWGAFLAMGLLNNVLPFSLIVRTTPSSNPSGLRAETSTTISTSQPASSVSRWITSSTTISISLVTRTESSRTRP